MYMIILASSLQLLMKTSSFPLPPTDNAEPGSGNDGAANSSSGIGCGNNSTADCQCNVTKILSKWLSPSKDEAGISKLTMATDNLTRLTDNKEVSVKELVTTT